MTLRFYREKDGKWYVDLPEYIEAGGDKAALEMIFGADTFLSDRCIVGKNEVTLDIQTGEWTAREAWQKKYSELIRSSNKLDSGAFYVHIQQDPISYECNVEPFLIPKVREIMWLCDVVKYIFGDFPKNIYFKVL